MIRLALPEDRDRFRTLQAGDRVLLSGILYTGRDAAHERLLFALRGGEPLPVDLRGQTIYYVGPCPAPPGFAVGSAGPTTSGRMDFATPDLLRYGLAGMIGKGKRSPEVVAAIRETGAVYFGATGGAGALLAGRIRECRTVAWPDLGTEAIHRLVVEDFPVIVLVDSRGEDLYRSAAARRTP